MIVILFKLLILVYLEIYLVLVIIVPNKDSMNQYFEGFTEDYELTCGQNNFTVKKFEIFQLEFNKN